MASSGYDISHLPITIYSLLSCWLYDAAPCQIIAHDVELVTLAGKEFAQPIDNVDQ